APRGVPPPPSSRAPDRRHHRAPGTGPARTGPPAPHPLPRRPPRGPILLPRRTTTEAPDRQGRDLLGSCSAAAQRRPLMVAQQPAATLLHPDRGALGRSGGAGGDVAQQHHAGCDLIGDELLGGDALKRCEMREGLLAVVAATARTDLAERGVEQLRSARRVGAQAVTEQRLLPR